MSDATRSLRIDFATEAAFRGEYVSNIAKGGVFIATNVGFAVRESVRVELAMQWCAELISLDGEVVHVTTPEMSGPTSEPGVAIQFSLRASKLCDRFEAILEKMEATQPSESLRAHRVARRARVRVPILVRTTDGREIEGRSCDLSTTGSLVEIEAEPVATGEVVQIAISNTASGEEIDVHGTIMRHVVRSGMRVALGIRFEIPPSDVDLVGGFLRELQEAETNRRLGGVSGPISEIGIGKMLRMFSDCSQHGTLRLDYGDDEAVVVFADGMLRGVQIGETYGREALAQLLDWQAGAFEFTATESPSAYRGDPVRLDAAVNEALQLLEESRLFGPEAIPLTAKLYVDREKLAEAGRELSQAEEAILDLAAVGMSVGKVIDVIPEPEEAVRRQLARLIGRGLIALMD